MQPISWQQFGLKKDPFDTPPLSEGGDLSIEDAFIGRKEESSVIDSLFESSNRVCMAICGDVGVGKTSFANFRKFIWKYQKPKLLFSFRREIEISVELLNKKSFLVEIIASVLREIYLMEPVLLKDPLLSKLRQLVDIAQTFSISFGATIPVYSATVGANAAYDRHHASPLESLSIASLEQHFLDLLSFVKNHEIQGRKYSGLVVHVNNFDSILLREGFAVKVCEFFNDVRDILQIPDVYFLFLGPADFWGNIISRHSRVEGVFYRSPLLIDPLSKKEVVQAFHERMSLLQSDDVSHYINPIEDEVVYRLYDLFNGDIRRIMSAMRDILGELSDRLIQPLSVDEAMLLLGKERWHRIENLAPLTEEQKAVLRFIIEHDRVTQRDIARVLNKAQSNMSGYYFKSFKGRGIIEEKGRQGKLVYWGLTSDYLPLKHYVSSRGAVQSNLAAMSMAQLSLGI